MRFYKIFATVFVASFIFNFDHAIAKTPIISANSGVEKFVMWVMLFNSRCDTFSNVIRFSTEPEHGAVTIRKAKVTLTAETAGRNKRCIGRTVPVRSIYYKSTPGFRGADTFTFWRQEGIRRFSQTIRVEVK